MDVILIKKSKLIGLSTEVETAMHCNIFPQ